MKLVRACSLLVTLFALTVLSPYYGHADSVLGSASAFAVLGASTVTNTGNTVLYGNLGLYPGTSITGFPPGIVNGTIDDDDAVAMQAQVDALSAYVFLAGLSSNENLSGQDLGGLTLTPGVYSFNSTAQLTGALTLNFEGLSNVDIVFQIGSALTTASGSMVNEVNMGQNDNVYWQIGSSGTLGTNSQMVGNLIADQSLTLNTGATINCGRAIALNGAVTLDDNTINNCAGTVGTTPEPGTIALVATGGILAAGANPSCLSFLGLGSIAAAFKRRKR